jgi:hypothetical protein
MGRGDNRRVYGSLHERLYVTCVDEPNDFVEGDCWCGVEKQRSSWGYCRITLRWQEDRRDHHRAFSAHILAWVLKDLPPTVTPAQAVAAYRAFQAEGLELDHQCNNPRCRRPSHLEPVTHSENERRKHERRAARQAFTSEEAREEAGF